MATHGKWLIGALLVVGMLAPAMSQAGGPVRVPDAGMVEAISAKTDAMIAREAAPQLARMRQRLANPPATAELTYYDLVSVSSDNVLDLSAGRVSGTTDVNVEAVEDDLADLLFWLEPMDDLTVTSEGQPLSFSDSGQGYITVTLAAPLDEGEQVTLTFADEGAPDCSPGFFGMTFCNLDEDLAYFGGPAWIPAKVSYTGEDLLDTADYAFSLTLPAGYVAAASARLVDVTDNGDGTETHAFESIAPTTGIDFAAAPYDVAAAASASGVDSSVFTLPGHQAQAQGWADVDADVVDFYEARYGDYLYGKIDALQVLEELGGGFATQSAVFIYESAFDAEPGVDWLSESIFAHEIGHEWWAFIVPLVEWESPWLNEGFAEFSANTFSETYWGEYYIDYIYDYYAQYIQYLVAEEEPLSGMDTSAIPEDDYFLLTYQKGAWLLRMLRMALGDEAFYAGMLAWAEGPGRSGSTTDRFQDTMETAAGEELDWFFDEWAWGTGWPHYKTAFARSEDGDRYAVTVTVTQEQEDLFDMPVPIYVWTGEAGDEESAETVFVERIDGREHSFTYTFDEPVLGVRLDSRAQVFARREIEPAGDINGDGRVNGYDLFYLAYAMNADIETDPYNWIGETDLNFDGRIDEDDRSLMESNFGWEDGDE